jgi:hypothetical protein
MSMNLSVYELKAIMSDLQALESSNLHVTSMISGGHTVILRHTDDQRDGTKYIIVGITDGGVANEDLTKLNITPRVNKR